MSMESAPDSQDNILVIKHGALGDIILCSGVLKTIREQHPDAHLTLLTTRAYAELLEGSEWFDSIWVDHKPKWYQFADMALLIRQLRSKRFSRVYDLQTSQRSSFYFKFFARPKPEWSGIAMGASHRHDSPQRVSMHTIDRQAEQLRIAGIDSVHAPDISWMHGSSSVEGLRAPYGVLVPGGSAHRPEKRYPEAHYITLAQMMIEQGVQPVLIGGGAEEGLLTRIADAAVGTLNLCNQTGLGDIADIARDAAYAVGNDTGPMHIIAATGCRSVVLFSHVSDPDLCAPRGEHVSVLREADLVDVLPRIVMDVLSMRKAS